MWRTGVTLLLVSLAVASAVETVENFDNLHVVSGLALKGKGPIQARVVHGESESLIAEAPAVQGTKPEEPKKEEHSSFSETLRVMRSNVFPRALNAVGLGRFADAQKTFLVPTNGKTISVTFGKTQKVAITTAFSFRDDVSFVYGSQKCTKSLCHKTELKNTFDESKSTKDTSKPTTFSYSKFGSVSGDNYRDQVTLVKDMDFTYVFGVANTGSPDKDIVDAPAEGYIGFGFEKASGPGYNTAKTVLSSLAPSRALTLWQSPDLKTGAIFLGAETYEKCPTQKTEFQDIVKDKAGNWQWWFKATKLESGDKKKDNPIVKVSIDEDTIGVPKDIYDTITKNMKGTNVEDPKNLPTIKLTVGKNEIVLDGNAYTTKVADKQYFTWISSTDGLEYDVLLGSKFFSGACVSMKQKDDSGNNFQIGLIYADPGKKDNSATSMTLSVFSLVFLPLAYFMAL